MVGGRLAPHEQPGDAGQGVIRYSHVGCYADGVSEVPFVLDELLTDPACGR